MSDMHENSTGEPTFDPTAEARVYGEHYNIPQDEDESDNAYRHRIAGYLRGQGKIIEAHEALSGRRYDDPEQGQAGPMAGIIGALAQGLNGREYSPHDPERQVGDDIAAGIVVSAGTSESEKALGAMFDLLGPGATMDVLDAFSRPNPNPRAGETPQ